MQLHLSTWPEVQAYLGRSRTLILPIGSTEQHGPTGLIGTDAICAERSPKASATKPVPSLARRSMSAWRCTIWPFRGV